MKCINWTMVLLSILITGCAYIKIPVYPSLQPFEETVLDGKGEKKILLVDIAGVISEKKESTGLGLAQKSSLIDRIFTAAQALDAKLIDRVGYLDEALEEMKASLKLKDARLVTYHRPGAYKGTIYSGVPEASQNEINLITINTGEFDPLIGIQFMYLWGP
jgi:hypothetical protein